MEVTQSSCMTTARKVLSLLTAGEKRQACWLVVLMIVCAVLEVAGLGLVVPALAALSGADIAAGTAIGGLEVFKRLSPRSAILVGVAALLTLYLLKATVLLYSTWKQVSFTTQLQARLSRALFATYMTQPWSFHLQRNSASFIRNINDVVALSDAAGSLFMLAAESLMIAAIVGLLLWREPWGAVAVLAITAAAACTLSLTMRSRLKRWGERHQRYAAEMNRHLIQGLHAAKDVILTNRTATFIDSYGRERTGCAQIRARLALSTQLPRLWYELIAVVSLCALTTVMTIRGATPQDIVPTLGLFAVAAFRLLPSVNRLAISSHNLHFSEALIDTIEADLRLRDTHPSPSGSGRTPFTRDIVLQDVSYTYPNSQEPAVRGVTLVIPKGASIGLIGESGAGKSTLVDLLLGLLRPTTGRILVDGLDIESDVQAWRSNIGYVPQTIYLCDDSIKRNVAFGTPDDEIDIEAVHRALRAAQLEPFVQKMADGLEAKVGDRGLRLSGGQRQRIGIARALYHDPSVLVLDEATSALDGQTEADFMAAINDLRAHKTVIIIAHRLSTVETCDLLYRLHRGEIVQCGTYSTIVQSP